MRLTARRLGVLILSLWLLMFQGIVSVAQAFPLIRDAEIEETLRLFSDPVFRVANLNPQSVGIHIINDDRLNAFVSNGQNMYMFAGLLMEAETPGEVVGVIAHEAGHIAGGHLVRTRDAIDQAQTTAIISLVLGAAAGILAKDPAATSAVITGSQHLAQRTFLSYSRTQERSADQAATQYLDELGYSSEGLVDFMKKLEVKSLLISDEINEYASTHPNVGSRINFIKNHKEHSPHTDNQFSPEFYERHDRMRAKLKGFLQEPNKTLREFGPTDDSLAARYAKAVAYYKIPDLPKALEMIDGLIADYPGDPYFLELKGQILFENGRIQEAEELYQQASDTKPNSALIRIGLAQAQLADRPQQKYEAALGNLRRALVLEPKNAFAWRLNSVAYGQKGEIGLANLSLAEYMLLTGRKDEAKQKAGIARKMLEEKSPHWYRAEDIINEVDNLS